jgi:ferredoxin--NADP+ reductase
MGLREAKIVDRTEWADGLWSMTLDAALSFDPGQFVNIGLRIDGELVTRSYSVASAPGKPLELFLVLVKDGALTPLLERMTEGDSLMVDEHAHGYFTLKHVPKARDGWLVGTGTGLAPLLSMIRDGAIFDHFDNVILVHGARYNAQLGYRAEIEQLVAGSGGRLRYVPLVTREEPNDALAGRIPAALSDGRLEERAGLTLDSDHAHVLLCGNPEMITEVVDVLAPRGMRKHRVRSPGHITSEKYW